MSDVVTIIPNWNGKEYLNECITSLKAQTHSTDIVVVDNGSVDGSSEFVRKNFPQATLIEHKTNRGFTGGVNRGIEFALHGGYEFIALFNNDAVAEKNWLMELVNVMKSDKGIGIVTGKFMQKNSNQIDSTGDLYSVWGTPFPRGRDEEDKGQYEDKEEVFAASGGASLYRADLFKDVGLFDQKFFAYYEDVDISFRARLAGWKVMYAPKAIAYHSVGGTTKRINNFSDYHQLKNYFYLYFKNMPGVLFWKHLPKFFAVYFYKMISHSLKGRFLMAMKAFLVNIWHKPAVLMDRYRIQKNRKVDTKEIEELLYKDFSPTQQDKKLFKIFKS